MRKHAPTPTSKEREGIIFQKFNEESPSFLDKIVPTNKGLDSSSSPGLAGSRPTGVATVMP